MGRIFEIRLISPESDSYKKFLQSVVKRKGKKRKRKIDMVEYSANSAMHCKNCDNTTEEEIFADSIPMDEHVEDALIDKKSFSNTTRRHTKIINKTEEFLRSWLKKYFALSDSRILKYVEQENLSNRYRVKYNELDAVLIEGDNPLAFIEFKVTNTSDPSARQLKGEEQLRSTIRTARIRWPKIFGILILLDVAKVAISDVSQNRTSESQLSPSELINSLNSIPYNGKIDVVSYWVDGISFLESSVFGSEGLSLIAGLREHYSQLHKKDRGQ